MNKSTMDSVVNYMESGHFDHAYHLVSREIERDRSNWNLWFLMGQCLRFMGRYYEAIDKYEASIRLNKKEKSIYLGLGISCQYAKQWNKAIDAFRCAIELDDTFLSAYNSLALTQKKMGELSKSSHNYKAAVIAMFRKVIRDRGNKRSNKFFKSEDMASNVWFEYAMDAALFLASQDGCTRLLMPSPEMATGEGQNEPHGGLYWIDQPDGGRLFLPNYFNTLRVCVTYEPAYAQLVGNRSTVLELLGEHEEAEAHLVEAEYLMRRFR